MRMVGPVGTGQWDCAVIAAHRDRHVTGYTYSGVDTAHRQVWYDSDTPESHYFRTS